MARNHRGRAPLGTGGTAAGSLAWLCALGVASWGCAGREAWIERELEPVAAQEGRPAAPTMARLVRARYGEEVVELELELVAPPRAPLRVDLAATLLERGGPLGLAYRPVRSPGTVQVAAGGRRRVWLRLRVGAPLGQPARLRLLGLRGGGRPEDPVTLVVPAAPGQGAE